MISQTWEDTVRESYPHINVDAIEKGFWLPEDRKNYGRISYATGQTDREYLKSAASVKYGTYGPPRPIAPKYSPNVLRQMVEDDPDLFANIDALAVNVGEVEYTLRLKFEIEERKEGSRTIRTRKDTGEVISDQKWKEVLSQKDKIDSFLKHYWFGHTFLEYRSNFVFEQESLGNYYEEVVETASGLQGVSPIKDQLSIRVCEDDTEPVYNVPFKVIEGTEVKIMTADVTFKRFVQNVKGKRQYYKSWKDPRVLDKNTGMYYDPTKAIPKEVVPATPLVQHKLRGMDYGLPRYIPAKLSIETNKGIRVTNRETMNNGGVPKLLMLILNSTDKNVPKEIKNGFKKIKRKENNENVLVVSVPPEDIGNGAEVKTADIKFQVEKLNELQDKHGLFLDAEKANRMNITTTFRLSDLYLGRSDASWNRSSAYIAQSNAEKQVFAPPRRRFDSYMNDHVFPEKEFTYWEYVSNSGNIEDTEIKHRFMQLYADHGALLPNNMRSMAPETIGENLNNINEPWANQPKYLTIMEKRANEQTSNMNARETGTLGNEGAMVTAGLNVKRLTPDEAMSVALQKWVEKNFPDYRIGGVYEPIGV